MSDTVEYGDVISWGNCYRLNNIGWGSGDYLEVGGECECRYRERKSEGRVNFKF